MPWFLIDGINPEPWTASEASIGRKGGKVFVQFHKSPQLTDYQEAIKSEMREHYPTVTPISSGIDIALGFFFWRQLPTYEGDNKKVQKNRADATNMQKALEDALQGILYENDRDVVAIRSTIMAQGPDVAPRIVVACNVRTPTAADTMTAIWADEVAQSRPTPVRVERWTAPDDDLF